MFPPLKHDLTRHLSSPGFTPGGQSVYAGVRPTDDGWAIAVFRVDDCTDEAEAVWLGTRIRCDLLTHLRFANQEDVPEEAVGEEYGVPSGGIGWSIAVYVVLRSKGEAERMVSFFRGYARQLDDA